MRVMSFNIWSDRPRNVRWPRRREAISSILRWHRPDSAGLQEANHQMVQDLQESLPHLAWLGVGRDDGREEGEFNPIFYRTDRLALLDHGTFWLAADYRIPAKGWDARCRRIVTWARFRVADEEREFFHFNTHFDHFGRKARSQSALLLLQRIAELAGTTPAVATGDFNCREKSHTYRILTGALREGDVSDALRDCFYATTHPRHGPHKTWRGVRAGGLGSARLDYIFVKNSVEVIQYAVLSDRAESGYASDHLPVVVDLDLRDSADRD